MHKISPFSQAVACASLLLMAGRPALAQQLPTRPSAQALQYFAGQGLREGLREADVAQPAVTNFYVEDDHGTSHTYLRQRVNGLDVFGAVGAVHTDRTGKPVAANQQFVADAARLAPGAAPSLTPAQAVAAAAVALGLPQPSGLTLRQDARPADGLRFDGGGISTEDIPVRLFYFPGPVAGSTLRLAWQVSIAQLDQQHHWNVLVDAHNGHLLYQQDYVVAEPVSFQQQNTHAQNQGPAASPHTAARGTSSPGALNVWPVPLESPLAGPRTAVPLSSGMSAYSPNGWQVSQAPVTTPTFYTATYSRLLAGVQLTRGNNVAAYDDSPTTASGPGQVYSNTNSPDGGTTLDYDFPYSPTGTTADNHDAGIVNLFYWNNMLHDAMASKGFNEASGNFQYRNFGGQGIGNDFVRAEAQDGSGLNNANFSAPPDGSSGLMQMYLWRRAATPTLVISAPAGLARSYPAGAADFGRKLNPAAPVCGQLVLVNDGVSGNGGLHGCATPYANAAAVRGNIAVIMRGGCAQLTGPGRTSITFTGKVRRAQQNGAIMALIIDSVATNTAVMGMTGLTDSVGIRIPSLFLSGADGAAIRAALTGGSTVTGCANAPDPTVIPPTYDASFDNGIVSHEFGHGISIRLTGGPANSGCVIAGDGQNTFQAMGEGWSDFFGLWMTTANVATTANPTGVTGRTPRYIGTFVEGQTAAGPGIRIKPYTDDLSRNNYTYGIVATPDYGETHNVGEVWATVLWDLDWQFIYRYGFNRDFLAQNGGNNQFLKLVLDGCKLQRCNPGFLDGRNAILRADSIANGHANSALLWTMFARRGMGYSSRQGTRTSAGYPLRTGIVEAFDLPPGVTPAVVLNPSVVTIVTGTQAVAATLKGSLVEAYPNPAQDQLTVRMQQASSPQPAQITLRDALGRVAKTVAIAANDLSRGVELNTASLAPGLYIVQVSTDTGTYATKVQVQH